MSKRLSWSQTAQALRKGRLLMVTQGGDGPSYALDNGIGVAAKAGRDMTAQADLFDEDMATDIGMPCAPDDLRIVGNGDGLFPGFSQTYRVLQ